MSGTTIRPDTNPVATLDPLTPGETGPSTGAPPANGTLVLQDGRQLPFSQGKSDETVGAILDLIVARASNQVEEEIIRRMGPNARPILEQRNLETVERTFGHDSGENLLREMAQLDPHFAAELKKYGTEIDIFAVVLKAMLQDEALRCARRGEEMRDEQVRAVAEKALRDKQLRKAPLGSPQQLGRVLQHWGNQKGHGPQRETVQKIEREVRAGGLPFERLSEMVRQYDEEVGLQPPYTSESLARQLHDRLEAMYGGRKG